MQQVDRDLAKAIGEPFVQNHATALHLPQEFHDTQMRFHDGGHAEGVVIEHAQEIPDSFVSMLRQMKADSGSVREKEFMLVGCIPTVFVERYLRQGFNVFQEPVRETVKRLIRDGLDSFVVTNKRI